MIIGTETALEIYRKTAAPGAYAQVSAKRGRCGPVWFLLTVMDPPEAHDLSRVMAATRRIPQEAVPEGVDPYTTSFYATTVPAGVLPPHHAPPRLPRRVASFLKAKLSRKVPDDVFNHRKAQCTEEGGATCSRFEGLVTGVGASWVDTGSIRINLAAGEVPIVHVGYMLAPGQPVGKLHAPCPFMLERADGKKFCNACGCGERDEAELSAKLRMAQVTCPRVWPLFTAHKEQK